MLINLERTLTRIINRDTILTSSSLNEAHLKYGVHNFANHFLDLGIMLYKIYRALSHVQLTRFPAVLELDRVTFYNTYDEIPYD